MIFRPRHRAFPSWPFQGAPNQPAPRLRIAPDPITRSGPSTPTQKPFDKARRGTRSGAISQRTSTALSAMHRRMPLGRAAAPRRGGAARAYPAIARARRRGRRLAHIAGRARGCVSDVCNASATSSPAAPFRKDQGALGHAGCRETRGSTFSLPADAPRVAAGPGLPRPRSDPRRPGPPCPRMSGIMRATRGAQNRLPRRGRDQQPQAVHSASRARAKTSHPT